MRNSLEHKSCKEIPSFPSDNTASSRRKHPVHVLFSDYFGTRTTPLDSLVTPKFKFVEMECFSIMKGTAEDLGQTPCCSSEIRGWLIWRPGWEVWLACLHYQSSSESQRPWERSGCSRSAEHHSEAVLIPLSQQCLIPASVKAPYECPRLDLSTVDLQRPHHIILLAFYHWKFSSYLSVLCLVIVF